MSGESTEEHFKLPKKLEKFLAILSRRYKGQGNETFLKIVVNAKPEVDVGVDYDNWNGGQSGIGSGCKYRSLSSMR